MSSFLVLPEELTKLGKLADRRRERCELGISRSSF